LADKRGGTQKRKEKGESEEGKQYTVRRQTRGKIDLREMSRACAWTKRGKIGSVAGRGRRGEKEGREGRRRLKPSR